MNRAILAMCLVAIAAGFAGCSRRAAYDVPSDPVMFNRADCAAAVKRLENALGGRCTDDKTQAWLDEVLARVAEGVPERHVPPRNLGVTLANSLDVALYVFADGRMVVTRGLLARVVSEDELAAQLAAGIAHVTLMQRPVATAETDPPVALKQKFVPAQERESLERAAFYLASGDAYNPYAVWGIAFSFEKIPRWAEVHPLPQGGSGRINDFLNERYPEFIESARHTPLPERIQRLVKKQVMYFAEFAKGEQWLREYLSSGGDAQILEKSLPRYNMAIQFAEKTGDLPAAFLARRGVAREMLLRATNAPSMSDAVMDDLDRAKHIDPDCYWARLYRGVFFLEVKKFYGPAREELQLALALNPGTERPGEACYYTARLYDDSDNPDRSDARAAEFYRKYLALEPTGPHASAAENRLKEIIP